MSIIVREKLKEYYYNESNIDIDMAISELMLSGSLSEDDLTLIEYIKEQYSAHEVSVLLKVDRTTIYRRIKAVCGKIGQFLGFEYLDTKIFSEVEYILGREMTEDEIIFCNDVMVRFGYKRDASLGIYNFSIVNGKVINDDTRKNKE